MAINDSSGKVLFGFFATFALVFSMVLPTAQAQKPFAPGPAPASDSKFT